ncbi:MAG: response regulator transcription factor [Chloroflexi bacterium]|nr:response regulator transcription factor [Chloroflexota bacterium]
MMKVQRPLRVALMDDDFYSLKWNTALCMRDPRTTVVAETESPTALLAQLQQETADVVVVDAEFSPEQGGLSELLDAARSAAPQAALVCLTQYGERDVVDAARRHGARAILLKGEVRMALVSALATAHRLPLVATPGVLPHLDGEQAHVIPVWKPNPGLTPQIMKSFWLRVFFGMRASLAAEELFVETATVERYVNQAYKILPDHWADDAYLEGVDLNALSAEDQAFLWFTLPPRMP